MDPMLYVIVFDSMQRQLDDNARLRLLRARADVAERRHPVRAVRAAVALRLRAGRTRATAALAPAGGDLSCCPA